VPTAFLNVAEKRETSSLCLCRELHLTVSLDGLYILAPLLIYIIVKNVMTVLQKAHCVSITKTKWLILFREVPVIAVDC